MFARLREALAHAFSTAPEALTPEDDTFLAEIARRVAERRLIVPAMLGSEVVARTPGIYMGFFGALPIAEHLARHLTLGIVRTPEEARRLVRLSERREHVEAFLRKLEAQA